MTESGKKRFSLKDLSLFRLGAFIWLIGTLLGYYFYRTGGKEFYKEGYSLPLLDQLVTIVSSMTIITYSLYTFSAENLPPNHVMMLTIPFVIYAIFRYLYLIQVKNIGGEPEEILLSDRPFQVSIFLWGLAVLAVFYLT